MTGSLDPAGAEARIAFLLALRRKGLRDTDVLRAFETVPRGRFVPRRFADLALADVALPIACGQSTPAPSQMAELLCALDLGARHRVLEIGAGSGYGTALLSRLAAEVVAVERYRSLVLEAQARLQALGIANARILHGDGREGARGFGSFDRILINAAISDLPGPILAQLAPGGTIVAAERLDGRSVLARYRRNGPDTLTRERLAPFSMAPLMHGIAAAL